MSNGVLQVTVVECRNLKDNDRFGKIDAFIALYLDKEYKQRTKTIKKSKTPMWHETFRFNIHKQEEDHLYVEVYDEHLIGKSCLGSTKIDFKRIEAANGYVDEWFQLSTDRDPDFSGEIHLILRLT